MTAEIDRPELERSLKKYSSRFGDSSAQAVIRWSVQTCRELAFETQPWGSSQVRKRQEAAVYADILNVVIVSEKLPKNSRNKRNLESAADVVSWMDENRSKGKRTKKLPISERKVISRKTLKQTAKAIMARAGIAKGGFLGAGQQIARAQRGNDRVAIGKNFLSYAAKHERFGRAIVPSPGFKPRSTLSNRAAHTSAEYVLKKSSILRAINWGLKKTVKWYSKALKAIDKKKP